MSLGTGSGHARVPWPETLARILAAATARPSVVLRREREQVLKLAGRRRTDFPRLLVQSGIA